MFDLSNKSGPQPKRHCHHCGWEWTLSLPPGRTETCHQCGADMKVCLNCVHYDAKVAHQCRERRAEPVAEKHMANFCEYFEMIRRVYVPRSEVNKREEDARNKFKKLLGD
jgi:hypothetical protein